MQLHFVDDLDQVREVLAKVGRSTGRQSLLAAIVFANPKREYVKTRIVPMIGYWNHRSRDWVSFFFVGYHRDESQEDNKHSSGLDNPSFDEKRFVDSIESLEGVSSWKYTGETALWLCRAVVSPDSNQARLDLSCVVEFSLERAEADKAIVSVESLFEDLIRVSKSTIPAHAVWKMSDLLGTKSIGQVIVEAVCNYLPGASTAVAAIRDLRVKDLT